LSKVKAALAGPISENATKPVVQEPWQWHRGWCVGYLEALSTMLKLCEEHDFKLDEAVYWQTRRAREVQERIVRETGSGETGEVIH
jgi:hypothetical protein